ncbi:tetratricopeptide repeat protein [Jiella marina]|uniref:tetratricopeptide repeat protein n=1 Tax=Jiella sp. LLJ827 TaxID=2917712 RepID=UPI0021007E14|nr:tetratricopeptide repeat protein [Jiella sp. LLJ827]MCQ0989309.1 tetratricopeptide repeat protein [Jiella sp. LLJ827]
MRKTASSIIILTMIFLAACQSNRGENETDNLFGFPQAAAGSGDAMTDAKSAFRSGQYEDAYRLYEGLARRAPDNAEAWLGYAAAADQLGRFRTADAAYGQLFRLRPRSAQVHNNVGYSHLLRGDLQNASRHLETARQLAPLSSVISNNIKILQARRANSAKESN